MPARTLKYVPLDDLRGHPDNPKNHLGELIGASIDRFGYVSPQVLDERTGLLAEGHGRLKELQAKQDAGEDPPDGVRVSKGKWLVPVVHGWSSSDDREALAYLVASNQSTIAGGWDLPQLGSVLDDIRMDDGDLLGTGYDAGMLDELLADVRALQDPEGGHARTLAPSLADRFLAPPFSVLDARQGYWQDRKRAWLSLGIRSEEGRAHNLVTAGALEDQRPNAPNRSVPSSHSGNDPAYYWKKQEAERQAGRELTIAEFEADWFSPVAYVGGTSIFDPVLCEIAYRWFCPPAGRVLDPFAGGSVRGIVGAWLGCSYSGVELRAEQVESNRAQGSDILGRAEEPGSAVWTQGDSRALLNDTAWDPEPFDLVFSCPPYYDLEVYSDEPGDLSAAPTYEVFLEGYQAIIAQAVARLADDRFAVWVVGDLRGADGSIRGLVPDTISAFAAAGAQLHNDAILLTAVGSVALRAARIFSGARRLARCHQYVLVFVKGDPRAAVTACGELDVPADLWPTEAGDGDLPGVPLEVA